MPFRIKTNTCPQIICGVCFSKYTYRNRYKYEIMWRMRLGPCLRCQAREGTWPGPVPQQEDVWLWKIWVLVPVWHRVSRCSPAGPWHPALGSGLDQPLCTYWMPPNTEIMETAGCCAVENSRITELYKIVQVRVVSLPGERTGFISVHWGTESIFFFFLRIIPKRWKWWNPKRCFWPYSP